MTAEWTRSGDFSEVWELLAHAITAKLIELKLDFVERFPLHKRIRIALQMAAPLTLIL